MLELKLIRKSELNDIEPLWKKLNALHYQDSRHFKHHYESFTYKERSTKFKDYDDDSIRIECLVDIDGKAQGYCISTIKDKVGEQLVGRLFLMLDIYIRSSRHGSADRHPINHCSQYAWEI